MGAVKQFFEECACVGRCPLSTETHHYLDDLECRAGIDWIESGEHAYTGYDGETYTAGCITMESARRLVAEGLANEEIAEFVEFFGDYLDLGDLGPWPCDECGCIRPITLTTDHGERFCADCQ